MLTDPLFADPEIAERFNERAELQAMLDFEAALARAEAAAGVIPARVAGPIAAAARAEDFDLPALADATRAAGNSAIPMVKELTSRVARLDSEAARYVHWGATSQDAIDTGLVLQLHAAQPLLDARFASLCGSLAAHSERYAATPMVGRTWLQHAVPTTFGLKVAGWLSATVRARRRLAAAFDGARVLQFGGAAGNLAALGDKGLAIADFLARDLDLTLPDLPWHAHRDRLVELAAALGIAAGTLGKIARDLSLLMQTDVAEAFEPSAPGRGGSSAMPHKRNPVACAVALSVAVRAPQLVATMLSAMPQEHERGLGGWHAEWPVMPELTSIVAGSLRAMADALAGLTTDPAKMRSDIDLTHGLVYAEAAAIALGSRIGRSEAHHLVEGAARRAIADGRTLREVFEADPEVRSCLEPADLEQIFAPEHQLGMSETFLVRALAEARR